MMLSLLLVQSAFAQDLSFAYPMTLGEGERPGLYITAPRVVGTLEVACEAGGRSYEFSERNVSAGVERRFDR